MSTNFYLHENFCKCCGRSESNIHIGKSSIGWCFFLHVTDEIKSLFDWGMKFGEKNTVIIDDYGETLSIDEMMNIIKNRSGDRKAFEDDLLKRNHAERGPNNLYRCIVDNNHCIGHGAGTWDLITGDFS